MRCVRAILFFFFFVVNHLIAEGQKLERVNSFSYNVNEGLLQSTISDIAFDKNNFCWLSFPNGIQKFDGKNFTSVPVQPGLPDDKSVYFFRSQIGDLLISHQQGISRYEINSNKFIEVYNSSSAAKKPAQFIGEDDNIIYVYAANGSITGMDSRSYKIVSEIKMGFPDYTLNGNYQPRISDNIINHKAALLINLTLYLWDLKNGKLLMQSAPVNDISLSLLKLKTENEVLYCNNKATNALQLYNFASHMVSQLPVKGKDDKIILRCVLYSWQNNILLSFNNKLYKTDSTLQILKSEFVNFQNQPVAGIQAINSIKEDNFGNLYLQTISGGIKKIIRNNYPFKYYSTGKPDGNFVISILPDKKNNHILAGTAGNGLLIFDTLQHLVKHIKTLPGRKQSATVNTIIKTNKGSYLLFIVGEKQLWELNNNFSQIKSIPISTSLPIDKSGIEYFGNVLFHNEQEAIIQSQKKIYSTHFSANTIIEHLVTQGNIMSGLLYKNFIITHGDDELFFLDATTFKEIKRVPFKNTGNVRCFAKDEKDNIYVGSNKGIFKIDSTGKMLQHLAKETGLPDECIYAMDFDAEGFLWCSTNKGILKINKDNSFRQFKKEDGLQENEFNTNAVATSEDGEIFFGGVNGISSFYPDAINSREEIIKLLITNIKVNNEEIFADTAVWNISTIDLPYHKNSLSFDFTGMGNDNPGQYIYQYKMEGIDEQWIQNNELQTVRYFLPPGKYVFQIYASRFFNNDAKAMKEISIIIHPPFWKTWWFITALAILFITILALGINQYNKRQYQKKLGVIEGEQKMQMERERISRDLHDSLGAYANAVLYNTELLQQNENIEKRDSLINDVRFASKDIITALRETVWALKKDVYTADECMLRIRNFVQAFTRYYGQIQFKIEGDVPAEKILPHNKAFHLVRIVQESISNAIKHANAKNIIIESSKQNGNWNLTIKDDGKGFDYATTKQLQLGNGLNNMEHRAKDAKIKYTLSSVKNVGTTVSIIT